jgi:hypothetical protein
MYVEIVGRWIDGPLARRETTPRKAQPIAWPREEDGVISLRLVDENELPVLLALGTDSITLNIGYDLRSGALLSVSGTAGGDPGQYLFAIASTNTRSMDGPMVYEVRAVKSSLQQQVVVPAYFTVTPSVAS